MRLAIVGSGALGSLFAAHLSKQTDLVMLGHWPDQINKLRSSGLTMIHPGGQRTFHTFEVTDNPSAIKPVNIALVLVKAYQTGRAARDISQFIADSGLVVTLQNGLGNRELLANILGPSRVTQGVTALGATMVEPGLVQFAGYGPTHLAQSPEASQWVEQLAEMMNESEQQAAVTGNLAGLVWGKLAINAGINPLTSLLRVPNSFLVSNSQARNLMCAAAEETAAVARALNIELPYQDASQRAIEVAQATAENRSSMLQDIQRGSQTEIEAINGAVVRYGRSAGVFTPVNDEFLRLVRVLPNHDPAKLLMSRLDSLQALMSNRGEMT